LCADDLLQACVVDYSKDVVRAAVRRVGQRRSRPMSGRLSTSSSEVKTRRRRMHLGASPRAQPLAGLANDQYEFDADKTAFIPGFDSIASSETDQLRVAGLAANYPVESEPIDVLKSQGAAPFGFSVLAVATP